MKQGTKNLLLLLGFVLLLFTAYHYSFSKTYGLKKDLDQLHLQIYSNSLTNISEYDIPLREQFLDSIIKQNFSGSSLQNDLLEVLNKESKKNPFTILSFNEPHSFVHEDKSETTSYQFAIEGNYNNIESLLYKLEMDHSFGSLSHISFERKKDYKLNKEFLQCSVVMQHVK